MALAALDQTIVATALPSIAADLGSIGRIFWIVTAYLVTLAAATPLYGKLSDTYGRRNVMHAALLTFIVGSILSGLAQSIFQLTLFRGLQGIGAGGLAVIGTAGVGDLFSSRERGKYMGYMRIVFGVATIAGPLVGGYLTDAFSWRWVFFINVPLGFVAMALIETSFEVPVPDEDHPLDIAGAILLVVGVSALMMMATLGGDQYAWDSWAIIALAMTMTVTLPLFFMQEQRADEPIVPLRLFDIRTISVSFWLSLLSGAAFLAGVNYLPIFIQTVLRQDPTSTGIILFPLLVGYISSSVVGGALMAKTGKYKYLVVSGMAIGGFGYYLLATMGVNVSLVRASVYMFIAGLLGVSVPVLKVAMQNAAARKDLGAVSAVERFARSLGGTLGVAVFGIVLDRQLTTELRDILPSTAQSERIAENPQTLHHLSPQRQQQVLGAVVDAFHDVFLVGAVMLGIGFLIALLLPELELSKQDRGEPRAATDGGVTDAFKDLDIHSDPGIPDELNQPTAATQQVQPSQPMNTELQNNE